MATVKDTEGINTSVDEKSNLQTDGCHRGHTLTLHVPQSALKNTSGIRKKRLTCIHIYTSYQHAIIKAGLLF